jgi:uncharacterized protein (DUF1697 family)
MVMYIALLRGINVSRSTQLGMPDLTRTLESLGLREVQTYLRSGNVVFRSPQADADDLANRIRAALEAERGLSPQVLVLTEQTLLRAIEGNPFPEAAHAPKSLHVYFLAAPPQQPDLDGLTRLKSATERFSLADTFFYLHAPDGVGRSKLAARAERLLGVEATARNWRSVTTLLSLARGE